jgi:hypothetical protein
LKIFILISKIHNRKFKDEHNKPSSYDNLYRRAPADHKGSFERLNSMTSENELLELSDLFLKMSQFAKEKAEKAAAASKLRDIITVQNHVKQLRDKLDAEMFSPEALIKSPLMSKLSPISRLSVDIDGKAPDPLILPPRSSIQNVSTNGDSFSLSLSNPPDVPANFGAMVRNRSSSPESPLRNKSPSKKLATSNVSASNISALNVTTSSKAHSKTWW